MPDLVAWLNDLFDAAPDKTSSGLANALDIDKSAVTRMKKGERQLKAEEIPKICAYFSAPSPFGAAPAGFAEDETVFEGAAAAPAPIFESAADGDCWRINRATPIDERPRAPHFGKAAMVFGLYAPDGAMAPRFKPGEIVWVDPARPARAGDDALFVAAADAGGAERAILGEYEGERTGKHIFRQHRDGMVRNLDASIWKALYVLPRY